MECLLTVFPFQSLFVFNALCPYWLFVSVPCLTSLTFLVFGQRCTPIVYFPVLWCLLHTDCVISCVVCIVMYTDCVLSYVGFIVIHADCVLLCVVFIVIHIDCVPSCVVFIVIHIYLCSFPCCDDCDAH